jgi:hypothetical protein
MKSRRSCFDWQSQAQTHVLPGTLAFAEIASN